MATTALIPPGPETRIACRARDPRRARRALRPSRLAVSLLVGMTLVSLAACASDDGGATVLGGDDYVAAMNSICAGTESRLAELPEPPEQISATDWATEVARAFRAEQTEADGLVVDESIRGLHRTYTLTTGDLATSYGELGTALATTPDDIGDASTTITELSLGRDDVAGELGLDSCVRSTR